MLPGRIEGATRHLGAPPTYDQNSPSGKCGRLAIRDITLTGGEPCIVSAWFPTPEEIEAMQRGEPVYVYILGEGCPAMHLGVKGVAGAE